MELSQAEIERYAPYHTYHEFKWGFEDYEARRSRHHPLAKVVNPDSVGGQAYDRGLECAMRRAELRRMAELEREANGQFGVGA